jgi:hypothetical protein
MTEAASFPMPFMISAEEAAQRICDGFQRNGFEIAFPRRMVWFLKALRFLPYWAYFGIVGQFAKRAKNV